MGAILQSMGYNFRKYSVNEINAREAMENVDILFINCQGPEPTWKAANNIREMVSRGGALYVSCYARKWIEFIWPGLIEFHGDGEIQTQLHAQIIDPGLQAYLGVQELYLNMNTHWNGIKKIKVTSGPYKIHVYMEGIRQGWFEKEPLLISFPYDDGFVIFTTFHNSHQVNSLENRLLQYLVLRPILAQKSHESNTIIQRNAFKPTKEVLGSLSVGEQSSLYEFEIFRPQDLRFIFNWQGQAVGRVFIYDPQNNLIIEENIRSSPCVKDISKAAPGIWRFKFKIVDAPMRNFPYIINVGIKDVLNKQIASLNSLSSENLQNNSTKGKISQVAQDLPSAGQNKYESLTFEILEPIRKILGSFDLEIGDKTVIGRNEFPPDITDYDVIDNEHLIIQLLDSKQIILKCCSNREIAAASYKGGILPEPIRLSNNIPVVFTLPLIIRFENNVMIGLF